MLAFKIHGTICLEKVLLQPRVGWVTITCLVAQSVVWRQRAGSGFFEVLGWMTSYLSGPSFYLVLNFDHSSACRVLVHWPGIEPAHAAVHAHSLNSGRPVEWKKTPPSPLQGHKEDVAIALESSQVGDPGGKGVPLVLPLCTRCVKGLMGKYGLWVAVAGGGRYQTAKAPLSNYF